MAFLNGFVDYEKFYNKAVADELLLKAKEDVFWYEYDKGVLGLNRRPLIYKEGVAVWVDGNIVDMKDGEEMVSLFKRKGEESFNDFDGGFVLVLLDAKNAFLYIVRDRSGIKPFYYFESENRFVFGSLLRDFYNYPFFNKELDLESLALFLQYGYITHPHTIYKNLFKLNAASYLEIDLKKKSVIEKSYWNILDFYNDKSDLEESKIKERSEYLLEKSVEKRYNSSSSPKGSFLSGGYDSAAVSLFLSRMSFEKIDTYTIGFYENGYDEAPFAKEIAKKIGSRHHEFYFSSEDARAVVESLPDIYDEPFGDKAALPTVFLAEKARGEIKSLFSGEGGDEVFATGGDMDLFLKINRFPLILRKCVSFLMREIPPSFIEKFSFTNFPTRYEKWSNLLKRGDMVNFIKFKEQVMGAMEIKKLFLRETLPKAPYFKEDEFFRVDEKNFLDMMLGVYFKVYMSDDELVKISNPAAFFGMELHEPFLDRELVEFLASVPVSLKRKNSVEKYLLKEIVHKYIPKEIMDRPKRGFSVPLDKWLREDLSSYLEIYLKKERIDRENIFDFKEIERIKKGFCEGKNEYAKRIWLLLMFEMWYEKQYAL